MNGKITNQKEKNILPDTNLAVNGKPSSIGTRPFNCPGGKPHHDRDIAAGSGNTFWHSVFWNQRQLWLISLPGILWYIIFAYGPMYGLIIAFENYSPGRGMLGGPWVGFKWFKQFFESQFAWRLIRNTLLISLYGTIFSFPAPIILAILLNEMRSPLFKRFVQTVSYLPHFISTVIVVGMMVNFLAPDGLVNNAIAFLGGERRQFMALPQWFRFLYIGSGIWQNMGWNSIIYLAAIAGINAELYEAATVDGASRFRQIFCVTLPSILPTIVILLVMQMGHMLSVGYEKIILMYNSATYETADVISTYVYRRGIGGGEFSFGAAVGMFQSVINLVMIVLANRLSRKITETSLW
jgi:putative aldouronate transport system permease protein